MHDGYQLVFGFTINEKRYVIYSTSEDGAWDAIYMIADRIGASYMDVDKYNGTPDDDWLNRKL